MLARWVWCWLCGSGAGVDDVRLVGGQQERGGAPPLGKAPLDVEAAAVGEDPLPLPLHPPHRL